MARRKGRSKKGPHPPRECRICGSNHGPWTREDAYPVWLRKRINEWLRALPGFIVEPGWEQGRRILLKPVCQRCQRRLNELFEIPTHDLLKAMMDGSVIPLSPRQQILIAGWLAKTALILILERTQEEYAVGVLQGYLHHMLEHGTPPPNATARIAYLGEGLYESRGGFLPPGWPKALDPSRGVISVISVPGFIGETLMGPQPVIQSFIEATHEDDRFLLVWPPQITAAPWPPAVHLGMPDSEALRQEWNHSEWYGNFPTLTVPVLPDPSTT